MAGARADLRRPAALTVGGEPAQPTRLRRALRPLGGVAIVLVGALLLIALLPFPTGELVPSAEPAPDYAAAVALYEQATADEAALGVLEQCRSRLLTHGRRTEVSVVLFHGWTNCPRQFAELGQQLYDQGANVLILRAPLHGFADASGTRIGNVDRVGRLSPYQLRDYADLSVDIADGLGRERRVLGLSMGGDLAAWVAQNRPDVQRAVVVSPALSLHGMPGIVDYAFRNVFGRLPDIAWAGSDTFKLDHAYAGISTHSLASVFRLAQSVREQAATSAPAVKSIGVVTNANDQQIDNGAVAELATDWRAHGADVTTYEFPLADGLTHDVIDVQQQVAKPDLVYPILLEQLGFAD